VGETVSDVWKMLTRVTGRHMKVFAIGHVWVWAQPALIERDEKVLMESIKVG